MIEKIILPPPVYELLSRPSAACKLCSVCNNPICSSYADLASHFKDHSCDNVCHLSATCSGFVNPRRTTQERLLSILVRHYHLHSTPTGNGYSSTQHDISPVHPTPLSSNSLLNQYMSLADAKSSKEKCAKCFAVLHSNTVLVRCNTCNKDFHQKSSTAPKASTLADQWKC